MTKPLLTGVLKTWKEDRGFGFITPDNGGRDVFIHISSLEETSRRPIPGDIIHYQVTRDRQGKFRAINASIEGSTANGAKNSPKNENSTLRWGLVVGFGLLIITVVAFVYLR
jgi:cold shock protein